MLLCLSCAAAEKYVPTSSTKLPDMLSAPACPEIVRVQKAEDSVTLTLDALTYPGVMHTALAASQRTWVTSISALDNTGAALWATRTYSNYK